MDPSVKNRFCPEKALYHWQVPMKHRKRREQMDWWRHGTGRQSWLGEGNRKTRGRFWAIRSEMQGIYLMNTYYVHIMELGTRDKQNAWSLPSRSCRSRGLRGSHRMGYSQTVLEKRLLKDPIMKDLEPQNENLSFDLEGKRKPFLELKVTCISSISTFKNLLYFSKGQIEHDIWYAPLLNSRGT